MYLRIALCVVAVAGCVLAHPSSQVSVQGDKTKPDNTRVNRRDRNKAGLTADRQRQDSADVRLSAKIRRAILKERALSGYARNIKIISQSGAVTLKGPVQSEKEKQVLEARASQIAGPNVRSEIEVMPAAAPAGQGRRVVRRKKRS